MTKESLEKYDLVLVTHPWDWRGDEKCGEGNKGIIGSFLVHREEYKTD